VKKKRTRNRQATSTVDILAFAAHADDIELTCGGTVLEAVARGQRVGLVDLTRGEMGTRGTPQTRLRESREGQKRLGAEFRVRLDLGDGNLRTDRDAELQIIALIREHRPSLVIAPHPDDRHPDHTRTGRLVTEASFYSGLRKIETSLPAHRPQAVAYYLQNYVLHPTFVVDITSSFEKKMHAVAAYRSQFYTPSSKEPETFIAKKSFLDMIEARARHFGALIGVDYGEAFITKQPPRIDDLVAAYRGREV